MKSFQRQRGNVRPSQLQLRPSTKFRKCVVCYKDLLQAKKYYTTKYRQPGSPESLGQRVASILNETVESVCRTASHVCTTCKTSVENVEKGKLSKEKFQADCDRAHFHQGRSTELKQQSMAQVKVVKRMARSPGKISKRQHLEYECGKSVKENIPPGGDPEV